eukprot:SAG22_NODE_11349_length_489_cov_0.930769_1_plen_136_part_01
MNRERDAAFISAKKLRFQFDVEVKPVELERDAVADPICVVLQRGPKVSKSKLASPCNLLRELDGFTGYGRYTYDGGAVKYTGHFKDGLRHGRGCLRFATGQFYDGFWKDDQYSGTGRFVSSVGVYEGEYSAGLMTG